MASSLQGGQWEDDDANGTNLDPSSSLLLLLFARGQDNGTAPIRSCRLRVVSSIKPYATSPYFRRIFALGVRNLEERQQVDVNLNDVEGALRSCFGINKGMVRVIADTAAVAVASNGD